MRRLRLSLISATILTLSLAGTALGHEVLSIDCDKEGIEVQAHIGAGHILQVIINDSEEMNEAVDGDVENQTFFFPWSEWPADVEVTIFYPQGGEENSKDKTVNCGEPDIFLEKTNDTMDNEPPGTVTDVGDAGEAVKYTFKITNNGDFDLTDVQLTDDIFSGEDEGDPACEDFDREADAPGDGDNILNPGETWVFTCTRILPVGEHDNEACVYADVVDESTDNLEANDYDVSACDNNDVRVVTGGTGGETGTPPQGGSIPDTATSIPSQSSPVATLVFGLLLVSSLGALAYANVRSGRR